MNSTASVSHLESFLKLCRRLNRDILEGVTSGVSSLTGLHALIVVDRSTNPTYCTNRYIANELGITEASVSSLMSNLLDMGLVERITGSTLRSKPVKITTLGKRAVKNGTASWGRLEDNLFGGLTQLDRNHFFKVVDHLHGKYEQRRQDESDDANVRSLRNEDAKNRLLDRQSAERRARRRARD